MLSEKRKANEALEVAQGKLEENEDVAAAMELLYAERDAEARQEIQEMLEEAESLFPELKAARDAALARVEEAIEQHGERMGEYNRLMNEAAKDVEWASQDLKDATTRYTEAKGELDRLMKGESPHAQDAEDLVGDVRREVPRLPDAVLEAMTAQAERLLDDGKDVHAVFETLTDQGNQIIAGTYRTRRLDDKNRAFIDG